MKELTEKEWQKYLESIEPYIPLPFTSGFQIIKEYQEEFEDVIGNKAIISYVDFKDKKGKVSERFVMRVKWINEKNKLNPEETKSFFKYCYKVEKDLDYIYYDGYLFWYFKDVFGNYYIAYRYDWSEHKDQIFIFKLDVKENEIEKFSKKISSILEYENRVKEIMLNTTDYFVLEEYRFKENEVTIGKKAKFIIELTIK